MTDPIVFISRNRVKKGMLDAFQRHYRDSVPPTEADKPGTLVQLAYVSEDATEVAIVRLFPSAEAMDSHLQGADERSKAAYRFIEPTGIEIYGTPSNFAMEMIKKVAGSGIDIRLNPQLMGGFVRLQPGCVDPKGVRRSVAPIP
jgi:quinol monooxygenase YgiN